MMQRIWGERMILTWVRSPVRPQRYPVQLGICRFSQAALLVWAWQRFNTVD